MMKSKWIWVLSFAFLYSSQSFSCDLSKALRHTNPDGSVGGFVAPKAKVESTAYVGFDAKVCDKALVEANARVLENSVVKEDTWIREYSIISGRAVVSGQAVVWGSKNSPAIVKDDSKVYGNAKILTGSEVSEKAEIFGKVTLKDSKVYAEAKVCSGYILNNQNIDDDYFCSPEATTSYINVNLLSYKEDAFNKLTDRIIFEAENYHFSLDKNVFQIFINGNQVDPANINNSFTRLYIDSSEFIVEGENEINFSGRDEFNKEIEDISFYFIVGSESKTIELTQIDNIPEESFKITANFLYEGREYEAFTSYQDGEIKIEGIPENLEKLGFEIKGMGEKSLIVEKFSSIEDIPQSLNTTSIPAYENNTLDFSDGLSGWSISHPNNIQLVGTGASAHVSLSPDESERVELSKTVKLTKDQKGFGLNFNIDSNLLRMYDETDKIQIIMASHEDKNIEVFEYSLEEMKLFKKNDRDETEVSVSIPNNSQFNMEFTVVVRLFPSGSSSLRAGSWIDILGMATYYYHVTFDPENFSSLNSENDVPLPPLYPDTQINCDDLKFNLARREERKNTSELIRYFSAGYTYMMNVSEDIFFRENRIYGRLRVDGIPKINIKNVKLIGEQYGTVKFEVGLSKCSLKRLYGVSSDLYLDLYHDENLVMNLFSIDANSLMRVQAYLGSTERTAADIALRVKVEFNDITSPPIYSNYIQLKTLTIPALPDTTYSYNPDYSVDFYDSNVAGILRTGGDKWIQPAYSYIFAQLLTNFWNEPRKWLVNDISKINGGKFLPHETHDNGLDADVIFESDETLKFDLKANYSADKWKEFMDILENFFIKNEYFHRYIKEYNLTFDQKLDPINSVGQKYLLKRFNNRCIGQRFIHFTKQKNTGSLIRDVKGHSNHIHIDFDNLTGGYAVSSLIAGEGNTINHLPSNIDIDDFWFTYDSNSQKLIIEPKKENQDDIEKFANRLIFWRFQNKSGFEDVNQNVKFGDSQENKKQAVHKSKIKPFILDDVELRYIYITIGNKKTGWCVQREIEVDVADFIKKDEKKKWTYVKSSGGFELVLDKTEKK